MRKMKVIIKDPGAKPRCVWISKSLDNLQRTVGGCYRLEKHREKRVNNDIVNERIQKALAEKVVSE